MRDILPPKKNQKKKKTSKSKKLGANRVKRVGPQKARESVGAVATRARSVISPRPSDDVPGEVSAKEVAKERKEVLKGAKKYIYPIAQSRFKIVYTSVLLFAGFAFTFLAFGAVRLYAQSSIDDLSYRIARIVPFPVARVEGSFVSFEDYLFEVRQNVHFFSTQDSIDFTTNEGKAILANVEQNSLDKVKARAIIEDVADERDLTVTDQEVEDAIAAIVEESNIADGEEALATTLRDFFDWDRSDFERSIRNQILEDKVLPFVDDGTLNKALDTVRDLRADLDDLEMIALERSEDSLTGENGGRLGVVSRNDDSLPAEFLNAAFALQTEEVSEPVETDLGIHVIVRLTEGANNQAEFAHVLFTRKDAETVIIESFEDRNITTYYTPDEFIDDGSVRPDANILPPEEQLEDAEASEDENDSGDSDQ